MYDVFDGETWLGRVTRDPEPATTWHAMGQTNRFVGGRFATRQAAAKALL